MQNLRNALLVCGVVTLGIVSMAAQAGAAMNNRITEEKQWSPGGPSVILESAKTHICFLTAIRGKFEGDREQVQVRIESDVWVLDGVSNNGYHLNAKARCLKIK